MTQSPLAVKRRREAGKPPIVINQNKEKDKKKKWASSITDTLEGD